MKYTEKTQTNSNLQNRFKYFGDAVKPPQDSKRNSS